MAMKKTKSKKTIQFLEDYQSQEEEEQSKRQYPLYRDYISLKMKGGDKAKANEGQVAILAQYSQENYKQYVRWLSESIKLQRPYTHCSQDMTKFLRLGANICIYGVGSKKQYLKYLIKTHFSQNHVWEVKGYLPSLNEKKVYNHFGKFLMNAKLTKSIEKVSISDLLVEYREILESKKTHVVIIFHCIDGQNFLNSDSQSRLSELFSLPYIQLICSLDNAKIVRHWHPKTKQRLKLLFYNVNTKIPNIEEQYYKEHTNEKKDGSQRSFMNIWQSLNKNQKKILKIIIKNELDNLKREESTYYTTSDLLDLCIEEVILASQVQLRENLFEILDHKVICEKTDEKRCKKIIQMKNYEKKLLQKMLDMKIQ